MGWSAAARQILGNSPKPSGGERREPLMGIETEARFIFFFEVNAHGICLPRGRGVTLGSDG